MQLDPKPIGLRAEWTRLAPDAFDAFTTVLLYQEHADADEAWSPDDSGGDEGIDFLARYGLRENNAPELAQYGTGRALAIKESAKTTIYQLKCYKDGLTSKPESRKQQILRSFVKALQHEPDEWVLVFPSKIKPKMRSFLMELPNHRAAANIPAAAKVTVRYLDQTRLDSLLAKHPTLLNLLERNDDYLMRQVALYGQEKAVLANGIKDLAERVTQLGELADHSDPHWGANFSRSGDAFYISPRPKHPRAAQESPISQQITLHLDDSTPELTARVKDIVEYGARSPVRIPGSHISLGDYEGPDLFRMDPASIKALEILACEDTSEDVARPARIVARAADETVLADAEGVVTYTSSGTRGATVEMKMLDVVNLQMRYTHVLGQAAQLDLTIPSGPLRPAAFVEAAELIEAVHHAAELAIHIDGAVLGATSPNPGGLLATHREHLKELRATRALAEDLVVIQSKLRRRFPMPEEISEADALWARALRIMLTGGVTPVPLARCKFVLEGALPEERRGSWMIVCESRDWELFGKTVHLPTVVLHHPDTAMTFDEEAGTGVGVPEGGEVFLGFMPDHVDQEAAPPTPWNLPDVEEPPFPNRPIGSPGRG